MAMLKLTYNSRALWLGTGISPRFFVDDNEYPYLRFEFTASNFEPTNSLLTSEAYGNCVWVKVMAPTNQWDLVVKRGYYMASQSQLGYGLPFLFGGDTAGTGRLKTSNLGGGTCKLIRAAHFDYNSDIQSFDRMFANCTGITSIVPIQNPYLTNVGGMYTNCGNIESGALDQYNWFNTYGVNINNHSSTFTNCGANTVTGLAELDQIPVGWGGNLVPVSTLLVSTALRWKNNYDTWAIDDNYTHPDWTNIIGMHVFTEASVSKYAGVSMNRSRIATFNGLGTTQSTYALYFYPCFMQHTSSAITWAVVTSGVNGSLAAGQGNTDMPGTLDDSTYGAFTYEVGSYDSSSDVYFCFLVTNSPIDSNFTLSDPYGVLFNSAFKTDAGLRYYF